MVLVWGEPGRGGEENGERDPREGRGEGGKGKVLAVKGAACPHWTEESDGRP